MYYCFFRHILKDHRGRIVVGFTTTYAISLYHHFRCEFKLSLMEMCGKLCQLLKASQ